MKNLKLLSFAAALCWAGSANANLLEVEVTVSDTDPGSVRYVNFFVASPGTFDIGALGADTLGAGYNPDPQIYLFEAVLGIDTFLVSDDDGGAGADALLAGLTLPIGPYVLAVSQGGLTLNEAVAGSNVDNVYDPGRIRVSIRSADGLALPEPASASLVAAGAAAFAAGRRRPRA